MTIEDYNVIREHPWVETENEAALVNKRRELGMSIHVAPWSVLVAAMGNLWEEGCYDAVYEMAKRTHEEGYRVKFFEEPVRSYHPYDAIGTMRNHAYMKAIHEGYEYLCYVDNDVKPEPDLIIKLLKRHVPIIVPVPEYPDENGEPQYPPRISAVQTQRNHGLAIMTSSVLSFVLFRTAVFIPWALIPFWENALGADESYHWTRMAMLGHQPFLDTDVSVKIMKLPGYPLDHRPGSRCFCGDEAIGDTGRCTKHTAKREGTSKLWKP